MYNEQPRQQPFVITLPKQPIFDLLNNTSFVTTFSGSGSKYSNDPDLPHKVVMRTLEIRDIEHIQVNIYTARQHRAYNIEASADALNEILDEILPMGFTQAHLQVPDADHYFRVTKNFMHKKKTAPTKNDFKPAHDANKNMPINQTNSEELLKYLNITDSKGVILHSMRPKFKQLNQFINLINTMSIASLNEIRIVDAACGKSYLSLTLYHYLVNIKGKTVFLTGVDSNKEVINFCTKAAEDLGFANAEFVCSAIDEYETDGDVDLTLAFYAPDTATDDALALAIRTNSQSVFCVPFEHHYLNAQLKTAVVPEEYQPLVKDGIVRERFANLLTDAMRRDILRAHGYKSELIEYISPDYVAANIALKAERIPNADVPNEEILASVRNMRSTWNSAPKLAEIMNV
ncbi:MAG: methyltransferase [Candidatus Kapabacteria bacterium]|nr:methyltransferase [Candidatus Kapabacteria bacterium]